VSFLLVFLLLKVDPGTSVSHSHTFSVNKEESAHDVKRTQKYLHEANEALAHKSSHDIGTPQTALGCIKILSSHGFKYGEIAEMAGIPLQSVKDIANSRKPGTKSLEALQQLVFKIESKHSLAS
jgi:hypothetical protein